MLIEPAELHRVYPPVSENVEGNVEKEMEETIGNGNGNSLLQHEIQFLRDKLANLERMTGEQRRQLSDQIVAWGRAAQPTPGRIYARMGLHEPDPVAKIRVRDRNP